MIKRASYKLFATALSVISIYSDLSGMGGSIGSFSQLTKLLIGCQLEPLNGNLLVLSWLPPFKFTLILKNYFLFSQYHTN